MKIDRIFVLATIIIFMGTVAAQAFEINTSGGKPIYWNAGDLPVEYHISSYGCPDCEGSAAAIELGAQHWNDVSGSTFEFVRESDTDIINGPTQDNTNVILFYDPELRQYGQGGLPELNGGTEYVAVNMTWFDTMANPHYNEIIEFDIVFNGYLFQWDTSQNGTPGKIDVENVATHELGHSLSLADLYIDEASEMTMYGLTSTNEIKKRTLEYDDIDGIRYLYNDDPESNPHPASFDLRPNYPNPATAETTFAFSVADGASGVAEIVVYDIKGRTIAKPFSRYVGAGVRKVEWDIRDSSGVKLPSGVYLYSVTFGNETKVQKMVVN